MSNLPLSVLVLFSSRLNAMDSILSSSMLEAMTAVGNNARFSPLMTVEMCLKCFKYDLTCVINCHSASVTLYTFNASLVKNRNVKPKNIFPDSQNIYFYILTERTAIIDQLGILLTIPENSLRQSAYFIYISNLHSLENELILNFP